MTQRSISLNSLQRQLIRQTQAWALQEGFDPGYTRELRHAAILANHARYLERIPTYQRFAREEAIGRLNDIEPIKQQLMFPDDLFKSYDQQWLDNHDFSRMNIWLSQIFTGAANVDVSGIETIDAWVDRLADAGTRIVYSSGTSGNFSFVPRDPANWALFRISSSAYLAPLLINHRIGTPLQRLLVGLSCRLLKPETFARLSRDVGMREYDAFFLDFEHGRTGNQTLEQEIAPLFRRHYFLYETTLSSTVLRLVARGWKTDIEREQLHALQEVVVERKEQNYGTLIERIQASTAAGQKIFIFGTTHQFKELSDLILARNETLAMKEGSIILFGGGWKSFTGDHVSRDCLIPLMTKAFNLPEDRIIEGYSMTEINAFTLRCNFGRFHIPPFIEPVIFDEQLQVADGNDLVGVFGFLDALATAYPGFIISGDKVHFVNDECECGLSGPAVTKIGRATFREVKGCGGIMASLSA
ncbi:MAG: hypothetical protein JXB07_14380 [Anaerolineae bacterium]|nr:hypothetical protein [Anaerolineae bacterium]